MHMVLKSQNILFMKRCQTCSMIEDYDLAVTIEAHRF